MYQSTRVPPVVTDILEVPIHPGPPVTPARSYRKLDFISALVWDISEVPIHPSPPHTTLSTELAQGYPGGTNPPGSPPEPTVCPLPAL